MKLPNACTQHGAIKAANTLAPALVVVMGIYVVEAFLSRASWPSNLHILQGISCCADQLNRAYHTTPANIDETNGKSILCVPLNLAAIKA